MQIQTELQQIVVDAIRNRAAAWPADMTSVQREGFLLACDYHGVAPLLHWQSDGIRHWPAVVRDALRRTAIALAMKELRHQQVLATVIAKLRSAGIEALVFKGTALAYALYPDPVLRPRGDTDLIVPPHERARAHAVLAELGFETPSAVTGSYVSYQASYVWQAPDTTVHALDLHWRLSNSELLSQLFTFDELHARSRPLPSLCEGARAVTDTIDALLIACLHRGVHQESPVYVDNCATYGGDRLIWLYDIHLLATRLEPGAWWTFLERAREKGLCGASLEGLQLAQVCFGTEIPPAVALKLADLGADEPVTRYFAASVLGREWMNLRALGSWSERHAALRETCFPDAGYMRDRYAGSSASWMPWLYARRAATGVGKRLVRSLGRRA